MLVSAWGILSSILGALWLFLLDDILDSLFEVDSDYSFWDTYSFFFYPIFSIVCFISAVYLLKRKNWARITWIAALGLVFAYEFYGFISMILFVFENRDSFGSIHNDMDGLLYTGTGFGLIVSMALCALSAWLMYRLSSASVKGEFTR